MKQVQLAELGEHVEETIEAVRKGETISLVEGERTVARIEPNRNPIPTKPTITDEEWVDRLVAAGVGRKGPNWGKPLPEDFFTRPRPKPKASVLEQLLEDRRTGD